MNEDLCAVAEGERLDVFGACDQWVRERLADLRKCRVRADAAMIARYIARWSPRDGTFGFSRSNNAHPRFLAFCGELNAEGEPWSESRVRSCVDALAKIGFLDAQGEDTICYECPKRKKILDTPRQFRFSATTLAILGPGLVSATKPLPPESLSVDSVCAQVSELGSVESTLGKDSTYQNRDSLIAGVMAGDIDAGLLLAPPPKLPSSAPIGSAPGAFSRLIRRVDDPGAPIVVWGRPRRDVIARQRAKAELSAAQIVMQLVGVQAAQEAAQSRGGELKPSSRLAAHNAAKWRL